MPFASVEEALAEMRAGNFVIVVDDEDRENEGDLVMAGEFFRLVQRSSELSRPRRLLVFLHHAAFSLAILCACTAGVLMTFGFPRSPLWMYVALSIPAALLLNPARSDARMMARLFSARARPLSSTA